MVNKKGAKIKFVLVFILSFALNVSTAVFADNYGIDYSGGQELGAENTTINPDLVNNFTPLLDDVIFSESVYSTSSKWEDAYSKTVGDNCRPVKYFRVSDSKTINESDNLIASFSNEQYVIDIHFKSAGVDGFVDDGKDFAISPNGNWIDGAPVLYSDAECETQMTETLKSNLLQQGSRLFVDMDVKLRKKGANSVFVSDKLYFGIIDIDAAQSFKILNQSNVLTKNNMFVKNAEDLQYANPSVAFRNMYVTNNDSSYIYSQYDVNSTPSVMFNPNTSNIYVKLDQTTQQDGLDIVFGFGTQAGSRVEYYAQQYTVNYASDDGGDITGIATEEVISGEHPSGTTDTPKEHYVLNHWVADVDVTINNQTVTAGTPLTLEQILQVVVDKDITFSAVHSLIEEPIIPDEPATPEEPIAVPDTGEQSFISDSSIFVTMSVSTIVLLSIAGSVFHRKISKS